MRHVACCSFLAIGSLVASRLPAQASRERLTILTAVTYALEHNPDLVTARLQVDSAHGELQIARALPNPTFAVAPGNPTQYSITQLVDVGLDRRYRTRAATQGERAVQLDVANATRLAVFTVRQSFLDLLLAEELRDIAFSQDTIVARLLRNDSLRYREGDLALRDLSTTELQFAHAEANLAHADATARGARVALQLVLGVPRVDTGFRVDGSLEYRTVAVSRDSLGTVARTERPDIAAANVRVEQGRSLSALASSLLLPVPGVAAVYQREPFSASGSNYAVGLSFSLPVLDWFSGERRRAAAGLHSAEVNRQRTIVQAESDIVTAVDNLRSAQTLAARYAGGLLDKANAALEMQRFAYEHGNASLLDLLNAINAFGDTQSDYYTALHDYWVAVYTIDRAAGRDVIP